MKFKKFMALALAGAMTFAMAGTAFAMDDGGNGGTSGVITNELSFTKKVDADTNVATITDTVGFTLSDAAAFAVDGKTYTSAGNLIGETPETFTVNVSKTDGSFSGTQELHSLISRKITKPGVYFLKLDETTEASQTAFGWTTVDGKVYWIAVFAAKAQSGSGYDITYAAYEGNANGPSGDKVTKLEFNNTYNKDSGGDDSSFEFTKALGDGSEYADPAAKYKFTATLTYPTQAATVSAKITDSYASADAAQTADIAISKDTTTYVFYLKGGDTAKFVDLPVGATVVIEENDTGSITNWKSLTFSGDASNNGTTKSAAVTLVEAKKAATGTNAFTVITPTGLAISIAPFIAMFAAVGAAIALYVAAKRRVR